MPSPERSRASPAASPTNMKRGPARRPTAHHVGVSLEGLDGHVRGQASGGPQRVDEGLATTRQAAVTPTRAPDPDIHEILLGEVPAVAAKIRLDVELGCPHEAAEALDPLRGQPRLALLGRHDLLALRYFAEDLGHGATVAARPDDQRRLEASAIGHHRHAVRSLLDRRDSDAPAHVGPGGGRPLEQVVIELAADDAVAG